MRTPVDVGRMPLGSANLDGRPAIHPAIHSDLIPIAAPGRGPHRGAPAVCPGRCSDRRPPPIGPGGRPHRRSPAVVSGGRSNRRPATPALVPAPLNIDPPPAPTLPPRLHIDLPRPGLNVTALDPNMLGPIPLPMPCDPDRTGVGSSRAGDDHLLRGRRRRVDHLTCGDLNLSRWRGGHHRGPRSGVQDASAEGDQTEEHSLGDPSRHRVLATHLSLPFASGRSLREPADVLRSEIEVRVCKADAIFGHSPECPGGRLAERRHRPSFRVRLHRGRFVLDTQARIWSVARHSGGSLYEREHRRQHRSTSSTLWI